MAVPHESGSWIFVTKEELERNSPSRNAGMPAHAEILQRNQYCEFIREAGKTLSVPQLTISTAIVFCHRFFSRRSLLEVDYKVIASACLFVAMKVEETPKPLREVVQTTYHLRHKHVKDAKEHLKNKDVFEKEKEKILKAERNLIYTLEFDFHVEHPYRHTLKGLRRCKTEQNEPPKEMPETVWGLINDSMCTTLCLQFPATQTAIAVAVLACKFLKWEQAPGPEFWADSFNVQMDPHDLENIVFSISSQILDIYETPKPPKPPKSAPSTSAPVAPSGSAERHGREASSGSEPGTSAFRQSSAGDVKPDVKPALHADVKPELPPDDKPSVSGAGNGRWDAAGHGGGERGMQGGAADMKVDYEHASGHAAVAVGVGGHDMNMNRAEDGQHQDKKPRLD